jgi:tetratricopeptide (TPR) repeat protein
MEPAPMPAPTPAEEARHAEANQWTLRGIALLSCREPAALPEALACFEQAISLRRDLPLELQPWFRWGLTAGWMNRAEALHRLGRNDEALQSYDEAVRHLALVPPDLDEAVRWRAALAHMNRALVLRDLGAERLPEALATVHNAIEHLSRPPPANARERGTLGVAFVNQARMLLDLSPAPLREAQAAALRGVELLRELESSDATAAEAALHARHAFCLATAILLESPPVAVPEADAWIITATDAVEEGLALYQKWQAELDEVLRPVAVELFRFGGRIYLAYQPQFLAEYLEDLVSWLQASQAEGEFLEAAGESLETAAVVLRGRGPGQLGSRRLEDTLALLARLEQVAAEIRRRMGR